MTCIVGLCEHGSVWMGGDSAAVSERHYLTRVRQPKVFHNGPYLIGYTSSFRMGQLLEHSFSPPFPPSGEVELTKFMMSEFPDAVRKLLCDHGWLKKENDREDGGNFLVGVAGRLFEVGESFYALEAPEGYNAVGCGVSVALGALHATEGMDIAPDQRIMLALSAAEAFTTGVRKPFTVAFLGGVDAAKG